MYVTQKIKKVYKTWHKKGRVIFLQTPTQSGKTTFFFEYLEWFMTEGRREMKGKVLLLVSRVALYEKVIEDLRRFAASNYMEVNEIFDVVQILTYQRLECQLRRKGEERLGTYSCIFCDEAHYFLSDASFNPQTYFSYRWILQNGTLSVFMSATMDNVKKCIIRDMKLKKYDPKVKVHTSREFIDYAISPDYSQYEISFFKDMNIIPKMIGLHVNEKWGIFVASKKRGAELCETLQKLGYTATFVDAEFQNNVTARNEMQNITNKEWFSSQILIATPVLDTGVNIFDKEFKNIIVMSNTKEMFIQMIGRKRRLSDTERIRLYLPCRDENYFDLLVRNRRENCIKPLEELIQTDSYVTDLMENPFSKVTSEVVENCCFSEGGRYLLNPLSVVQSFYEFGELIDNLNGLKNDKFYFAKKQLSWLEIDSKDFLCEKMVDDSISSDVKSDVEKILDSYVGSVLMKEDMKEILRKCQDLIVQIEPARIRSGREFSYGKLNEFCAENEILYKIVAKGGNRSPGSSKSFTTYCVVNQEVEK